MVSTFYLDLRIKDLLIHVKVEFSVPLSDLNTRAMTHTLLGRGQAVVPAERPSAERRQV